MIISNGTLKCHSIIFGDNSSISGVGGTITTTATEDSSTSIETLRNVDLDFSDIEVNLGSKGILKVGEGSTLRLANKTLSALTIISPDGQAHIDAPEKHLFKISDIAGQWHARHSFAQWFVEPSAYDWADAIDNALKVDAEAVYLPGQLCRISHSLHVPVKGRLIGRTRGLTVINNDNFYGTIIAPTEDFPSSGDTVKDSAKFPGNVLIFVNVCQPFIDGIPQNDADYYKYIQETENAWGEQKKDDTNNNKATEIPLAERFPPVGAEIADIRFYGEKIDNNKFGTAPINVRGIFVAGTAKFSNLIMRNFQQAIAWSRDYADCKHLDHVHIQRATGKQDTDSTPFAIDLQNLGDAAIVDGCHIAPENAKALRVNLSGGARISNNIINADVEIRNSKGIVFSSNHCENGPQITILNSVVVCEGNYFEKGERPSFSIGSNYMTDSSVVTLSNNSYGYYTAEGRPSCQRPGTNIDINNVNEYDVEIAAAPSVENTLVALNINNEMRYYIPANGYGTNMTTGIAIKRYIKKDNSYDDVKNFNNRAQFLSRQSCLSILYKDANRIQFPPFKYININNPTISVKSTSGRWIETSETPKTGTEFYYRYQIIYDTDRGIAGALSNNLKFTIESKITNNVETLYIPCFQLTNADASGGKQVMVRIFRSTSEDFSDKTTYYVDVPMCVASMCVDNGISVNGYKWKKGMPTISRNTAIQDVEFTGDNVNVWSTSKITNTSGWKRGDIIYNTGSDSSWTQQIIK